MSGVMGGGTLSTCPAGVAAPKLLGATALDGPAAPPPLVLLPADFSQPSSDGLTAADDVASPEVDAAAVALGDAEAVDMVGAADDVEGTAGDGAEAAAAGEILIERAPMPWRDLLTLGSADAASQAADAA